MATKEAFVEVTPEPIRRSPSGASRHYAPKVEIALKTASSLRKAAESRNEPGIESPGGGRWHAPSLLKAARRLCLR